MHHRESRVTYTPCMRNKEIALADAVPAATLNAARRLTLTSDRLGGLQSGGSQRIVSTRPTPRELRGTTRCDHYVTRTVKAHRVLPDGTWEKYEYEETVRVPFTTPRAERVRSGPTIVKEQPRRNIISTIDSHHDYTEQ